MKFDTTKPVENNEISADMSDEEEIEVLNTQLDQLHSALDTIEEKNDNIKARLLELLNIVKVNRDQLDQVESSLSEESSSELTSLREQLSQMEARMSNVMLPRTEHLETVELREQLNQLEVNVTSTAEIARDINSHSEPKGAEESSSLKIEPL